MEFQITSLVIIVASFGFVAFLSFVKKSEQNRKYKIQREKEFKENITVDPSGEAYVFRNLDEFERKILINEHKREYRLVQFNHYFFPMFALLILFIIFIFFRLRVSIINNLDIYVWLFAVFVYLFVTVFGAFYYKYLRENSLDKDLRSPVFRVTGELIKKEVIKNNKKLNYFFVRGIEFGDKENPQVDIYWDKWGDRTKVIVEYSPFTKHIWKIEKV